TPAKKSSIKMAVSTGPQRMEKRPHLSTNFISENLNRECEEYELQKRTSAQQPLPATFGTSRSRAADSCPKLSGQSGGNGYIRLQNHAFPKNLLVYRRKMRA